MGVIAHHAIIVTASYGGWPEKAHEAARRYFPEDQVSELSREAINGYRSFCIFPDGSKEGWAESADGNLRRDNFVEWLKAQAYEDGSSPLSWAEVHFGEIRIARSGAEVTRSWNELGWFAKDRAARLEGDDPRG